MKILKKLKSIIIFISDQIYLLEQFFFLPLILTIFPVRLIKRGRDVLHTGYISTKPRIICNCLKNAGFKADYMAFSHYFSKSAWLRADEKGADFFVNSIIPLSCIQFFGELWRFYKIVLKYRIIHVHSLRFPSNAGWELPILKKNGVKIVIHYRGCDIRDPVLYINQSSINYNCCQECDYDKSYCKNKKKTKLKLLAEKYGDLFLVTTPDLLDFVPHAIFLPFFAPDIDINKVPAKRASHAKFEIVHATNHDGIDGTKHIINAVEKLKEKGFDVYLNIVRKTPYQETLSYYKGADIAIGKLLMGFYANSQIESMMLGTPTAFYVRENLKRYLNGLDVIELNPSNIFDKLKELFEKPEKLHEYGEKQQKMIQKIHDNKRLTNKLIKIYKGISGK